MSAPTPHPPDRHEPAFADPERVRAAVDVLLAELAKPTDRDANDEAGEIPRRARILEQAHDVLVQALATVDKI